MISFKKSLREAVFKGASMQPVVDRIVAVLARRSGKKMYQFGGENYAQQFTKAMSGEGIGFLYLMNTTGEAIRLNWEKKNSRQAAITSCDYWKNWKIGEDDYPNPETTLKGLQYLNSVQLVDALTSFIKSPASRSVNLTISEAAQGEVDLALIARAA